MSKLRSLGAKSEFCNAPMRALGFLAVLLLWSAGLAPAVAAEPWTLEQALDCARTNSPDARLAELRIRAARAGLQQAEAAYWPRLQFQSSYTRTDNPMQVFGSVLNQRAYSSSLDFNDVPDADNLNVRGLLTVPLYNGGQNKAGRDTARAQAQATRQNREVVDQTLSFEVVRGFYTIIKTREFERAAMAAVHALASNLTIASNRFEAGTALKTEVLDLDVHLAQAQENQARARHAQKLARRALRNLLGVEDEEFDVIDSPLPPSTLLVPPSDAYPSNRPELMVLREQARAAESAIRGARGGYKPRLNAFGSLDYDRGWEFDGDGGSYTAGLLMQWDIWDGQLTRGKVNAARAELESIREQERKLRLAIEFELEQARLNHEEALERLSVTEKSVAQASESVMLTRARFEQGLALASQLIDAESALTAARVRRAEAESDLRIAVGAWRKALGLPQLNETLNP